MIKLIVADIHITYTVHIWQILCIFELPWFTFSNFRFKDFNVI